MLPRKQVMPLLPLIWGIMNKTLMQEVTKSVDENFAGG